MSDTFKQHVHGYCDIDDQLKKINKNIKELKEQQKNYSHAIMEYMSTNSIEVCNAGEHGVLTLKRTHVKGSLNKECLRDNLHKFICANDMSTADLEQVAENGAEYILSNRPTEERSSLKRSSTKQGVN